MDDVFDRAAGAFVGVYVADALGASVEFDDAATIARRLPDGVREIVGGGPFGWQPGQPNDDTDLTWAIERGYLENAVHLGPQLEDFARRMVSAG